jgi:hypothetical protein
VGIRIVPYRTGLVGPVTDFNARLREHGIPYQFPESPVSERLPKLNGRETYEEGYLAVDQGAVRGGYMLKHQPFWVRGQVRSIGFLRLPLSEGIVDRRYLKVGAQLFLDAERRQPLLYGLGIGGMNEPVVRMMLALGWCARPVPFYFRVIDAQRFLRQVRYLRTSRLRRGLLDVLAASRIGRAGIGAAQEALRWKRGEAGVTVETDGIGDWCDTHWNACCSEYALIGARDRATLEVLYPRGERFIRIRVLRDGIAIGWAVLLATQMSGHRYFGDMRVGSIVDCLAAAHDADTVIHAAGAYLERAGVDLIVSNQAALPWGRALRRCGYLPGPSNFVFTASRKLTAMLVPLRASFERMHITRGDGEGPRNL